MRNVFIVLGVAALVALVLMTLASAQSHPFEEEICYDIDGWEIACDGFQEPDFQEELADERPPRDDFLGYEGPGADFADEYGDEAAISLGSIGASFIGTVISWEMVLRKRAMKIPLVKKWIFSEE